MNNNCMEQVSRSFCVSKKNQGMIEVIIGAKASTIIYSIAEIAKANNLKTYIYFDIF